MTPEELASKACPFEPKAAAEMLFWRVWVEDRFTNREVETLRDHYVRVKIYSAAAAQEWTKHTVTLSGSDVRVSNIAARTIQSDGNVVPMDPHSVVKEVVARVRGAKIKTITFAIPAVRAGSIVEYRLTEVRDHSQYEVFPFQAELPARSIQVYLRALDAAGWSQRQMVFHTPLLPQKWAGSGFALFEVEDMPAFRREPNMPPDDQVQAWMLVYYSDEPPSTPAQYWRMMGATGARSFDAFVRADDGLRKTAKGIVEGAADPEEQLQRLVEWCRREIRASPSIAPESLRAHHIDVNKDARAVLRQRAGTRQDLDLLFGAFARALGFDVRYLRVPSRSRIYFDQEMMDLRFLPSYDIAVRLDGRWRCYDPQAVRLPWNMLPWDEESQMALFCDPDSTMFLGTTLSNPGQSVRSRSGELTLDEDGTLAGDVRVEASGHWNARLREALAEATDSLAAVREWLEWKGDWVELSALRVEPSARESDPLHLVVHARLPAHAVRSGRRMLLEPTAWWAHREPEFEASQRKWPVEFPFAWTDRDSLRIRLPAGWRCETAAAPRPTRAPGVADLWIQLRELESGTVLEMDRDFRLGFDGQILFPASSYDALRKLFGFFSDADRFTAPLVQTGEKP